jgi:Bacterial SH3 domain
MTNNQTSQISLKLGFIKRSIFIISVAVISTQLSYAQEVLTTNRATDIRAEPSDSAASLQALNAQTKVTLVQRKGAWTKVKTDTQTGWVKMMHLRGAVSVEDAPAQTKSGGFLSGVNRFLGGNQTSNQRAQSATLGIRGLSPEELKTASPDARQLAAMNANAVSKPDAERFAKEAPLTKTNVSDPIDAERGSR